MKPTPFRFVPPISPDQKACALPGPPGDIIVWDLPGGMIRTAFSVKDLSWTNNEVAFSPDARTLAVGFSATEYDDWLGRVFNGLIPGSRRVPTVPPCGGIKLLDVATGKEFATFEGAQCGGFSSDGKMWAMHGADGTIQIWDVPARSATWPTVLWALSGLLVVAAIICSRLFRKKKTNN